MSAKHWRRLKFLSYATAASGSAMFWVWGLSGTDPGRWAVQGDAVIIIVAVLLSQATTAWEDRARHHDRVEEIQRLHPGAIGNVACQFNARSPVIRCAVNPAGPCGGCQHYKTKDG